MGRSKGRDSADDTFGVRGAGATWQADFGMPLNEADLLFAVRREPIGKRNVFTVAHDIFDKFFKVEEVAEKPNPEWSREVSKVLDDLNAKAVLTQMTVFERLFGWAIIALTYVDRGKDVAMPLQDPKEIRHLIPYSSLQFTVQASDEDKNVESDRFGLPILYTVRRSGVSQAKLHYSRVIHCATQLLDHPYKGMSALECIYDDLTVWRNERWGFGQTIVRYGSGFPDVTIAGASKKDIDDFAESHQFKTLHSKSYFVHDEKKTLEFKGLAGRALDPAPYATPVLESLSCGTGIPLALLRGAQAGALTGSEVNEREYFKFISGLQTLLEPVIWELIDRLMETGQIRRVNDYKIVWLSGIELSEKDKAAVDLSRAQERNLKSGWMTVDEIRAEQDLQPLPNAEGTVVLGLQKAQSQPSLLSTVNAGKPGSNPAGDTEERLYPRGYTSFRRFVNWARRRFGRKDMISEVIADYLKAQLPGDRKYAVGTYYPGELPFCLRAQYFRYTQPKQAPADQEQLFGVGYLWQACIKEALDGSNLNVVAENKVHRMKVPGADLVLLCQPDFELDVDSKGMVLEVKSVASLGKFTQPMREHVLQVTPYIQCCKADSALIVYLNKQTGETKEFPVQFEEENLTLVFERAKRLDHFLRDKELPPKCGPGQDWQCKNCDYQTECETFSQ